MQPVLDTPRLLLRPYSPGDAADVQRLAGDPRIACTTANIPHPYPDGAAEQWIAGLAPAYAERSRIVFAVTVRATGELAGTVSLQALSAVHARAELGYWIAADLWGNGYCTEAASRLISFVHAELGVTRFTARCLARNPASARVMEKLRMRHEGRLAAHELKNGIFEDLLLYGLNLPERSVAG